MTSEYCDAQARAIVPKVVELHDNDNLSEANRVVFGTVDKVLKMDVSALKIIYSAVHTVLPRPKIDVYR